MSSGDTEQSSQPSVSSESIPYEAVPALAANEVYITKMDRLRELKRMKDELFELFNSDEKKGPLGEYEQLKRVLAAMQLVHGHASVTYIDLRVASVSGGTQKGYVSGQALINEIVLQTGVEAPSYPQLLAIAQSAKECDVQRLVEGGISPQLVADAKTEDVPRARSIRVEWAGAKGRRSGGNRGVGGPVQ